MNSPLYQGIMLIAMLVAFLGVWAWAWSNKRKAMFDEASRLPLMDDDEVSSDSENRN